MPPVPRELYLRGKGKPGRSVWIGTTYGRGRSVDWNRIEVLLERAAALPASRREEFLTVECGEDVALLNETLALLPHYDPTGDDLLGLTPGPDRGSGSPDDPEGSRRVGPFSPFDMLGEGAAERSWSAEQCLAELKAVTAGRYVIQSELGRGGMAIVYLARDLSLDRSVAIKLLPPHVAANAASRERFLQEARTAAGLSHPNIVPIHSVEAHDHLVFFVMSWIEGESLRERVKRAGRLEADEAVVLLQEVAWALAHAHGCGVIHHDVKPDNILIEASTGRAMVTDFGIAIPSVGASRATARKLMGTPEYVSPEQVTGGVVDERSDLYSLGVTGFFAVTGRLPFEAHSVRTLIKMHVEEAAPLAGGARPSLPASLTSAIDRCLAKEPKDRFQTAQEVAEALRPALETSSSRGETGAFGAPAASVAAGSRAPGWVPPSKRWWVLGLAASVLVGSAIGMLTGFPGRDGGAVPAGPPDGPLPLVLVRPFVDQSPAGTQRSLVDGLPEVITNVLSRSRLLRVLGQETASSLRDQDRSVEYVRREWNVDHIVSAALQSEGGQLRILAQVMNAASGVQEWSEAYDLSPDDYLTVLLDIAWDVRSHLEGEELDEPTRTVRGTSDMQAFDAYLDGRRAWSQRRPEGFVEALRYFTHAVDLDPDYAAAHSAIADLYNLLGAFDFGLLPPDSAFPAAKDAAQRALAIDSEHAFALAALAQATTSYDWDLDRAETTFLRSIDNDPGYAPARHWYALRLVAEERWDEAREQLQHALEHDPASPVVQAGWARYHYFRRAYDEAIAAYERSLELDPGYPTARIGLGLSLVQSGRITEGIEQYLTVADELGVAAPLPLGLLGHAYALLGEQERPEGMLRALDQAEESGFFVPPEYRALVYVGLGRTEEAVYHLERAFEQRSSGMVFLHVDPLSESLRAHEGFQDLVDRVGIARRSGG